MNQRARYAINDHDIAEAVDQLSTEGTIPDAIAWLIASRAEQIADKRLQKEDEEWKNSN